MKIAVVMSESSVFSFEKGASQPKWIYEVFTRLKNTRSEIDFTVISSFDETQYKGFKIKNIGIHKILNGLVRKVLPNKLVKYVNYVYPLYVAIWGRFIFFDLYYVSNRPHFVPIIKLFNSRAKIVLRMANNYLAEISDKQFYHVMNSCDAVIANSNYIATQIKNRDPKISSKVYVIYNGVNCDHFKPRKYDSSSAINSYSTASQHYKKILYVGRLSKIKGVHLLIKAVKNILAENVNVELVIAGTAWYGQNKKTLYVSELIREAQQIKDYIKFTGYLTYDQLPEYYASADVLVCPSTWQEPFGNVFIEGMASGLPVIGSNRGGIPEALGDAGIIIEPENVIEMKNAIVRILNDNEYARKMGESARQRAEKYFTWDKTANDFEYLLQQIHLEN